MATLDPFGSALQGYRLGLNDESNLQQLRRKARADDFNFFNVVPLQAQQVRNQTTLSNTALPFQQAMLPIGLSRAQNQLFGENLGNADEFLRRTGIAQPTVDVLGRQFGLVPTFDTAGTTTFNTRTPQGLAPLGAVANTNQNFFDYANQANVLRNLDAQIKLRDAQIQAQRAQAYWNYVANGGRGGAGQAGGFSAPDFVNNLFPGQVSMGVTQSAMGAPTASSAPIQIDPSQYDNILNSTFWGQ